MNDDQISKLIFNMSRNKLRNVAKENGIPFRWGHLHPDEASKSLQTVLRGMIRQGQRVTINRKVIHDDD